MLTRTIVGVFFALLTILAYLNANQFEKMQSNDAFHFLTRRSEIALEAKMHDYLQALDGGAALFAAADSVDLEDWRTYTETLNLQENLPGILGLGYIEPVKRDEVDAFLARARREGVTNLTIHPETPLDQHYVIKFIEPVGPNREAVGLDIAFEEGRRNAANLSRDTATPQITQRIFLVQDNTRQPGFLLLRPHYRFGAPLVTLKQRREAFLGWVYTPFVGASTLNGLTLDQGVNLEMSVYEGETVTEDGIIFTSTENFPEDPAFRHTETLEVFGQKWTVVWASTPRFEASQQSHAPELLLFAGLALSTAVLVFINSILNREKVISRQVESKTRQLKFLQDETRSVWENAVVPIMVLNDEGVMVNNNPAARDLLGPPESERHRLIMKRLSLRVQGGKTGTPRNLVAVFLPDGDLLLEVQRNRWTAPNGEGRTTMIVQNVTEEREAARRIEETEQRWNLALQGAKIGVFDIDLRTNKSVVSKTWCDLMDLPRGFDGDTQQYFISRIHPDDRETLLANDAACIAGDASRSVTEFRVRVGDDTWRWMRSDAVIVAHDKNGKATRMVGAQTDITEIRHALEALEASRSRFSLVLENAPVGMSILNEEGEFLGMNAAMCTLVGYSQDELLKARRFADFFDHEDIVNIIKSIGSKSENRLQTYQGEHLIRHKSGHQIWGLLSISWGFDPFEKMDIYIAQMQDITEKKNIEALKSSFVATVSHELRTPLTSMKGALGLVRANAGSDPKTHQRLVEIAYKNTDHLIGLVNDILDYEKIMAGEMSFDLTDLDLAEAIREAVRLIQPYADSHQTEISLDLPREPIHVSADASRLAQVLANLLSNACKFSAEKGAVQVRAERLEDRAIIYVQDNGDGIPSAFHANIFKPFSQADGSDTRSKGGTGLGLSITQQLVEHMSGTIGFKSPRKGLTIFWFSLPAGDSASTQVRLVG